MATIEEMENKMTLYFRKKTGEIKSFATGIQDMNLFGNEKEDYELIWDYIVLDKDEFVINNLQSFLVINSEIVLNTPVQYNTIGG